MQQTASQNYQHAIETIHAARDPRMAAQYEEVEKMQSAVAALVEAGQSDTAVELLTDYAYKNAEDWYAYWLDLGDQLYSTYMFDRVNMNDADYPDWWQNILDNAPNRPVEETPAN